MLIAQISDLHVRLEGDLAYRRVPTARSLSRAIDHLLSLNPRPDVVLATGDLVDSGSREEYLHLRRLLAPLPMPVYLLPGNHDDRRNLTEVFADHTYLAQGGAFLHYVVEDHPLRIVALDTLVPGQTGGLLCEDRLTWLNTRLSEARRSLPCTIHRSRPESVRLMLTRLAVPTRSPTSCASIPRSSGSFAGTFIALSRPASAVPSRVARRVPPCRPRSISKRIFP